MMHGQSLKIRDQSPFSRTSLLTQLLPKHGAERCCDFIASSNYEALFPDSSTVSNHALTCGEMWSKMYSTKHYIDALRKQLLSVWKKSVWG